MSTLKKEPKAKKWIHSDRYLNREFSWLQFNKRVLEEAANPKNPLLERLKFLAIFESNLDEFYMVRVSGLMEQIDSGIFELSPDGMSPVEQLKLIRQTVVPLRKAAGELWSAVLKPALAEEAVYVRSYKDFADKQRKELDVFFNQEIFPLCTPLVLIPAPSVPFISNRSLNLAVVLEDETGERKLVRIKVPNVVKRLIRTSKRRHEYILVEDLIQQNLGQFFPGLTIIGAYLFRVIRDADVEIRELEAGDLIDSIEQTIQLRRFGDPVLLEVARDMPEDVRDDLLRLLLLDQDDVLEVDDLIGFDVFWELAGIEKPDLRFPVHHPYHADALATSEAIFNTVRRTDVLVHHPYDSFRPIELFVESAAKDPNVIGIKQTLYRVGSESPIVESLLEAASAGKQAAAMVELKARFDESNNLVWARALERAGAHVTYGFLEIKTHAKLCLIVRREAAGIKTYAHIGTGNYNPSTGRLYSDLGLFTTDPDITQDIAELFNYLTGYSKQRTYRKLLVAPFNLRNAIIDLVHREIKVHKSTGKGRIIFKLNSLVDPELIDALYEAAEAGVSIDLIVRGICCLRAGLPELSQSVRVISVVGRFLEHSRVLYFENGGEPSVYIGSADLMRRNLDRRIEVLAPVEKPELIQHIRYEILERYLRGNQGVWEMDSEGAYKRKPKTPGEKDQTIQDHFMKNPTTKLLFLPESGS